MLLCGAGTLIVPALPLVGRLTCQNPSTHLPDSAIKFLAIRQLIKKCSRAIAIPAIASNIARAIAWVFETGAHQAASLREVV
jgi:hypothetical protein